MFATLFGRAPTRGTVRAFRRSIRRKLRYEHLEERDMFCTGLTSPDVNNDGNLTPLDALIVINALNTYGAHTHDPLASPYSAQNVWLDVSHDGFVSPLDALIVINHLNTNGSGPFAYECPAPDPIVTATNVDTNPAYSAITAGDMILSSFAYTTNTPVDTSTLAFVVNVVNVDLSNFRLYNAENPTEFVLATRVEQVRPEWLQIVFDDLDATALLHDVEPDAPATFRMRATIFDPQVDPSNDALLQVYADLNNSDWLNPAVHSGSGLVAGTIYGT